ncbi:MAG: hypothetical protein KDA45_10855 [Planctomycetales bacterium]|nr:hypothetical protein [Planctomycetales bacterium]
MKSDPQTSPREVQQVLQQLASSQAAKEVPWRVERFSQGTQAELFRVLGGPDLAQHGWPSPLVIKLFRDASAADRAAFENEKNGLQTLRQWLPASGAEGWSLDSPRLLHASENPLALVMSAVPGVPLERWLHTQRFSPAAAEALVRALLSALQTLWDRRFLYGDINLKNILYDAAEQRLCFVDPGLPAEYFRCPDVPQEWYPMSRDLAYLLYSVAVNVKHTLARPAARNRQLLLVSLLVRLYVESLESTRSQSRLLEEVRLCGQVHLQRIHCSYSLAGLWRRLVKQITQRSMTRTFEQLAVLSVEVPA